MSPRSPQQVGRANRRSGKEWQMACAAWLRDNVWPHASYELRNGSSDIVGTWDLGVECTLAGWDQIWNKLGQAQRDSKKRGLDLFCVWKKRQGSTDPGRGLVVMPAAQFFPLIAELEKRQRAEYDAIQEFARGFDAGRKTQEGDQ